MNKRDHIDDIDRSILRMLQSDARLSYRTIAKELDLSTGTVSQRVKRMMDNGTIRKFSAVISPEMMGKPYTMLVMIRSRSGAHLDTIVGTIEELDESCCIHTITGDFHLQVIVRLQDNHTAAEFLERLRNLPGVEFITSYVVLRSYKPFYEINI
jgi:Lrp/AsnC family leucine-responsive transcriptional regulator